MSSNSNGNNTVFILRGIPASGKTTWAKEYIANHPNAIRVNKDDLREMLHNSVWTKQNEAQVLSIRNAVIRDALQRRQNVIVDDTNLNDQHIRDISAIAKEFGAKVEIKTFEISIEEAIERDANRDKTVGEKVIERMARQKAKLTQPKFVLPNFDGNKDFCVICDIDGTLAMFDGNPYVRDFENDVCNPYVRSILAALWQNNYDIVLFSGRNARFEDVTRKWLATNNVPYKYLFMRKENDNRKDSIVKEEMLNAFRGGCGNKYNILCVFDDRKQVKHMWVQNGIFVFDVNQHDIEF